MAKTNYYTRILIALLFSVQCAFGQPQQVDSLIALLQNEQSDVGRLHLMLKISNVSKSDAPLALEYATESVELASRVGSDSLTFLAHALLGTAYQLMGNYPKALQSYQTAIVYGQKFKNTSILAQPYGNIGNIYYYEKDFANALKFYERALQHLSLIDSSDSKQLLRKSGILSNIGVIYDETREFDKAEKINAEALALAKRANSHEQIANVVNNQGSLYKSRGNNKLAFKYLQDAMEIRKQNNNRLGLARSHLNLGQLYLEGLKDYKKGEYHLEQAILIGREVGTLQTVNSAYGFLQTLYQERGDYRNAYEAMKNFQGTRDSLYSEENAKKITQMTMQFEFDRKQAQLVADQKARELRFWMSAGGLSLLLIIVTLLFFLQRSRAKRSELEQVRLGLEQINLKNELSLKDKELATNIMYLINKNELINTISEKLLEIKTSLVPEAQNPIQKIVLELQSNLQPELWKEFEFRFQQVHEQFYRSLNEKFPELTPSERRLCAFLKLNMTTKEISALTHQNAKSIDVARTRLRKKLNLTGTDHNLSTFLETLEASK
jgi:tetratricopeptide (TPR) repeat protein